MKNPVKNKESKELQKRVEKLEMENKSLKGTNVILRED